jgi:hypothetical protein
VVIGLSRSDKKAAPGSSSWGPGPRRPPVVLGSRCTSCTSCTCSITTRPTSTGSASGWRPPSPGSGGNPQPVAERHEQQQDDEGVAGCLHRASVRSRRHAGVRLALIAGGGVRQPLSETAAWGLRDFRGSRWPGRRSTQRMPLVLCGGTAPRVLRVLRPRSSAIAPLYAAHPGRATHPLCPLEDLATPPQRHRGHARACAPLGRIPERQIPIWPRLDAA